MFILQPLCEQMEKRWAGSLCGPQFSVNSFRPLGRGLVFWTLWVSLKYSNKKTVSNDEVPCHQNSRTSLPLGCWHTKRSRRTLCPLWFQSFCPTCSMISISVQALGNREGFVEPLSEEGKWLVGFFWTQGSTKKKRYFFYLMIFRWENPKKNNSKLNTVMYKKNYSTQPTGNNLQWWRPVQYLKIT